jgi:hypothetical protein
MDISRETREKREKEKVWFWQSRLELARFVLAEFSEAHFGFPFRTKSNCVEIGDGDVQFRRFAL